jgi:serine/threonine protein phosphatase PrpC
MPEGEVADMSTDLNLVQAYLQNIHAALANNQADHAQFLCTCAQEFLSAQRFTSAPSPVRALWQLHMGMGLDAGRKRRAAPNEDCVFGATSVNSSGEIFGLFVVTDGAGGQVLGQQAARMALRTCVEHLFPRLQEGDVHGAFLQALLIEGVQLANRAVYLRNEEDVVRGGRMCTTITAMVVVGAEACVANVGDSRTYHYHPSSGRLTQITRDHSHVADLVAANLIKPDEIYTHPKRNEIYRGLGGKLTEEIDIFSGPIHIDDHFLLCSDGLWEMVTDVRIKEILSRAQCSASAMSEQLVADALASGGLDNIAALVVQVRGVDVAGEQTIVAPVYTLVPLPS